MIQLPFAVQAKRSGREFCRAGPGNLMLSSRNDNFCDDVHDANVWNEMALFRASIITRSGAAPITSV
jgi:hypothetical protein